MPERSPELRIGATPVACQFIPPGVRPWVPVLECLPSAFEIANAGQAFLGGRGDQSALTVIDAAASETAGAAGPGAVHVVA